MGHCASHAAGLLLFGDDLASTLYTVVIAFLVFSAVLFIFSAIVGWKIFEKAGQPGWASLVPIYQYYVLIVEIAKMPVIWFILLMVPCVNFVVGVVLWILLSFKLAEKFGKDVGFGVGLWLLPIVFYPILAFGDAVYEGGGRGKQKRRYRDEDDDEDEVDEDEDDDDRPRPRRKKW